MNILVTSGGKRIDIIREFKAVLGERDRIFITDITPDNAGRFFADGFFMVPRINDPSYIGALKDIVKNQHIDLLCSVIDSDLELLASHKNAFEEMGCRILISDPGAIVTGRDKRKTAVFLERIGVRTPRVLTPETVEKFPIFIKPADGSSSKHAYKVNSQEEFEAILARVPNPLILEFIEGREYSIDCFGDFDGNPLVAIPRRRTEITNGISTKSVVELNAAIIADCKKIMTELKLIGPAVMQCIQNAEGNYFIEFNLRFGGGSLTGSRAGGDFFKKLVGLMEGEKFAWSTEGLHDGMTMVAYLEHIFYDKDYRLRS